ncbi:MAG: peptidase U32 family protein, partial [Victivallaceae bacterium]
MSSNTSKFNKVEIMAPAGSWESLTAAVEGGCDSVYFGVGSLNMRSHATNNFTVEDLSEVVTFCHSRGVKAYLALNIVVLTLELVQVRDLCDAAKKFGVDAVIASDFAVITYAGRIGLPVHISVQANVSNIEAVKFFANFADVVVLARELSLAQIAEIARLIKQDNVLGISGEPMQIEVFVHGALCVAWSGRCYMSLAAYGKSANRGECYQSCRRAYRVIDEVSGMELAVENKYVMSPKDVCCIEFLDRLLEAGVAVLKIEGRGRSADYVKTVVSVYREGVDACKNGSFDRDGCQNWLERLGQVFNRGFWHGGYYLGEDLSQWSGTAGNMATECKIHVGRVTNY